MSNTENAQKELQPSQATQEPTKEQLIQEIQRLNNGLMVIKVRCFDAEEQARAVAQQYQQLEAAYKQLQLQFEASVDAVKEEGADEPAAS